jgi:hypothetical protein
VTGLRVALVKKRPVFGVTLVKAADTIVGVTAVTTVVPGCPLTPLTTLVEVWLTPVTHVSAEAEANSPALRLTRLTASRRGRPAMRLSLHQSMRAQRGV